MAGNVHEIVVTTTPDLLGADTLERARPLAPGLETVNTAIVYRVEGELTGDQVVALATGLFSNPLDGQTVAIDPEPSGNPLEIEIGRRLGVMDPREESIKKGAGDLGIPLVAATTGVRYRLEGVVDPTERDRIASGLHNKTVERVVDARPETLQIVGEVGSVQIIPIIGASHEELMELSKGKLFLNLTEMKVIQDYFTNVLGRNPTDVEVELIAGRWSEHCGHKTFKALIETERGVVKDPLYTRIKNTSRKYFGDPKDSENPFVVTAFNDNAGGIKFYDGQVIVVKGETHNSPSALAPYGGAATGLGGVLRDVAGVGQGAENLASMDVFCVAPPDTDPKDLPPGTIHPMALLTETLSGVREYGNPMGISTDNGSIHFHPDFKAKPVVLVAAIGMIPESRVEKGKPQVGDLVVAVGGKTGRDGIHGATFSSGVMTAETVNVSSSAVQIGNPIEEKRMFDALIEARDADLIRAITDCGAAGFSSAVGEMGEGIGVSVDISKVPLKYEGLAPWEIWMSESQERMVVAIDPGKIEDFLKVCEKHGVEASVFGNFDGSQRLTVKYGEQVVADLDYDFLENGLPQRTMKATYEREVFDEIVPNMPTDWTEAVLSVMGHLNVSSKEPIVRQFDQTVQGTNAMQPYSGVDHDGPNDAAIITPILGEPYGAILAHGLNPILNRIDPYHGSIWAAAEAWSNYVAVGGDIDQAAMNENFIWPFPTEKSMGSLDRSVDAVVDVMDALKRPVISGKDSLSATYHYPNGEVLEIPPVLAITVMGRVPDVRKTVSADFKKTGSSLYLVGRQSEGMAGSAYYDTQGIVGNEVPKVDLGILPNTLRSMHSAIQTGEVRAVHDVSEGGVLAAVTEMAFGGGVGVNLDLNPEIERPDFFLFNETAGTFVVEVESDEMAIEMFGHLPHVKLGVTTEDRAITAIQGEQELFTIPTELIKGAWKAPMERLFQ